MKSFIAISFLFFASLSTNYAQELTMFPGAFTFQYYEDDQKISLRQVNELMSQDKNAQQYWSKSKNQLGIAFGALLVDVGFFIWAGNNDEEGKSILAPTIGIIAASGAVIGFSLSSSKNRRDAFLNYNKKFDVSSIHIGQTRNGLGLVLGF